MMREHSPTLAQVLATLRELWYEYPGIPVTWEIGDQLGYPSAKIVRRLHRLEAQGEVTRVGTYTWVPSDAMAACAWKVQHTHKKVAP